MKTPVVCGWCRLWIKPPRKGQPQGLKVSHGICTACMLNHFGEAPTRWQIAGEAVRRWGRGAGRALGQLVQRGGPLRRW